MNKKAIIIFSIITSVSSAAPPVTHQFTNGTTIEAAQVNANYQELADRIEVLQNQVVQLQNIQPKQLVGFTLSTIGATQSRNYIVLTNLCQAEFPGSRVCNTREIAETVNYPTLTDNSHAWVAPSKFTSLDYPGSGFISEEIIGSMSTAGAACLFVDFQGRMDWGCNNAVLYGASCCK